jgi:hypothetical protein
MSLKEVREIRNKMIKSLLGLLLLLGILGCDTDKPIPPNPPIEEEIIEIPIEPPEEEVIEEEPPIEEEEEIVGCNTNIQPTEIPILRWTHEDHPRVSYTLYYSEESISSTDNLPSLRTNNQYLSFDPIGLGIERCTTLYFRASAEYISCPTDRCEESPLSNEAVYEIR